MKNVFLITGAPGTGKTTTIRNMVSRLPIGADGFYGWGFERDGRGIGIALKIAGGDERSARSSAAIEILRQMRVIAPDAAEAFRNRFVGAARNHRALVVGAVATVFDLEVGPPAASHP